MENKETWVRQVMESTDGIQSATVSERLNNALIDAITRSKNIAAIRPLTKWSVAASIFLLIGFNVFSIVRYSQQSATTKSNAMYTEYFSYINEF